jgi:CBS domain containing-hemolysin-like protein
VVDGVSEYLAVTQIGITAASLGVGWFGESAFARLFMIVLPADHLSGTVVHIAAAVLAFLLITMMHVVVGELVPKNLGIRRPEHLLLVLVRPLQGLHTVLRPLHRLLEGASTLIVRRLGGGAVPPSALSEDELKLVLMDSHEEGLITAGEATIIVRALEFADRQAKDIMVPAARVAFMSLARTVEENLEIARTTMHARFPLCRDELDSVIGIVSMKDVWPLLKLDESNAAFGVASRPLIGIPADLSQDGILKCFQEGHGQMGIVRDEHEQHTLGVVTLEDVLDALVGDVREARLPGPHGARPRSGTSSSAHANHDAA